MPSTRRAAVRSLASLVGAAMGLGRASVARGAGPGAPPPGAPSAAEATPAAFMRRAQELRDLARLRGDQPYGAVVVRDGRIVGEGQSAVLTTPDPTAHAEVQAIRDAARRLGTGDLSGATLYGSAQACPMCETAAYWARVGRLYHGPEVTDAGAPRYPTC